MSDEYEQARRRARRQPTWWLRRRDRRIVAARPRPGDRELVELAAIRRELSARGARPAPMAAPA